LYRFSLALLIICLLNPLGWKIEGFNGLTFSDPTSIQFDSFLVRQGRALQPRFWTDIFLLHQSPRYTIRGSINSDSDVIDGKMEVKYTHRGREAINNLVFRLLANAPTLYGGELEIISASQTGKILPYQVNSDRTILDVTLLEPLDPGETTAIRIEFRTKFATLGGSGYGILGKARRAISLAGWYPVLCVYQDGWQNPNLAPVGDAVYTETSLYEVELTAPRDYQLVSTGTTIGRVEEGERVWYQVVSGPAREFAAVLSPRLENLVSQVGSIQIRYSTLPGDNARNSPQDGLNLAAEILKSYESRFGRYPWNELDLVDSSITIGGFEFSGMMMIDYDQRFERSRIDFLWLLAHEIAHQWWYGLVGSDQITAPWLDEALATYSVLIHLEDTYGKDRAQSMLNSYRIRADEVNDTTRHFTDPAQKFESWQDYNRRVYYQGTIFLEALRGEIGDDAFYRLIREYAGRYRYKIAQPPEFLALAEEITGRKLTDFYKRWILAAP